VKRRFKDLSPAEVIALAISLEEDARIYQEYARVLRSNFPELAGKLDEMRLEENGHRHRLIELFERKFGREIPLIGRQDVRGFVTRPAVVIVELLVIAWVRNRYMDTPFLSAMFQVVVGGLLVFFTGVLIGQLVGGGAD